MAMHALLASHPNILQVAVEAAVQAPSSHNTQPWRFRILGSVLEVFVDPTRRLPVIDGDGRQQLQSCGCALYNARVAVRAMGHVDEVTVMTTETFSPGLVATLRVGGPHLTTELDHARFAAIETRHTNRRGFLQRPVASKITDDMAIIADDLGATMTRLLPNQKHRLAELVDEADRTQYANPAFRDELARWLIPFGSRRHDGIPFVEKEYGSALPFTLMRRLRSPNLGGALGEYEQSQIEAAPVIIGLGTKRDDAASWLQCGEALQAVLLHATINGLSASFLNQVLEVPGLRFEVATLLPELGYPQMILRIGHAAEGIHKAAPRRPIADVLD